MSCAGQGKAELSSKLPQSSLTLGAPTHCFHQCHSVAPLFLQPTGEITINQWLI